MNTWLDIKVKGQDVDDQVDGSPGHSANQSSILPASMITFPRLLNLSVNVNLPRRQVSPPLSIFTTQRHEDRQLILVGIKREYS